MRIPKRLIDRDVSGANYSSMRADMLDTRRQLDPVQNWFAKVAAVEVYRRIFPQLAIAADIRLQPMGMPRRRQMRCMAKPDGWAYVDPQKDVAASIDAIRAGLSTWEDEIQARGKNPREVISQLEDELDNELLEKIFGAAPGRTDVAQQTADKSDDTPSPVVEDVEDEYEEEDEERQEKIHQRNLELAKAGQPYFAFNVPQSEIRNEIIVPKQDQPDINVHVEPTPVTVHNEAAQVRVDVPQSPAPIVNVEAPNVNVEAPNVTVEAPNVTVENEVIVPQRKVIARPLANGTVEMTPEGEE